MIITKLIGGLGNQMFQYAAARRLAHIHYTDLKLDITSYESYKLRKFELDKFNMSAQIATKKEIEKFIKIPKNILEKIVFNLIPSLPKSQFYYEEKYYHFDKDVLYLPSDVYLSGYWQSEKYFCSIKDIIRKDFSLKKSSDITINFAKKAKSDRSVSIHIRRGDYYVINPKTQAYHGLLNMDYYQRAMKLLSSRFVDPMYYIFSDDIGWVKKSFNIKRCVYVSDYGLTDNEEIYVMSNCKHNICANSSFSWWGAWLNENPERIVISPRNWFNNPSINTSDLIPETWMKI